MSIIKALYQDKVETFLLFEYLLSAATSGNIQHQRCISKENVHNTSAPGEIKILNRDFTTPWRESKEYNNSFLKSLLTHHSYIRTVTPQITASTVQLFSPYLWYAPASVSWVSLHWTDCWLLRNLFRRYLHISYSLTINKYLSWISLKIDVI